MEQKLFREMPDLRLFRSDRDRINYVCEKVTATNFEIQSTTADIIERTMQFTHASVVYAMVFYPGVGGVRKC